MDSVDIAILREMFEDGAIRLGGWDPRRSTADVAEALGLPVSTIKARMRNWVKVGFHQGFVVFPHPQLLGARIVGQILDFDSAHIDRFLEVASHVPNLVHGYQGAEDGCWVGYLDDGTDPAGKGARLLCAIPGVKLDSAMAEFSERGWHPYLMHPCPRQSLSPLDWRIILELRSAPRRPLARIAQRLGVSSKTVRRRYDRLLDEHALFFMPRLDFDRWVGVALKFHLDLEDDADANLVWRMVRALHPAILPHAAWYDPLFRWIPPNCPPSWGLGVEYWTSIQSSAESVAIRRALARIPGVKHTYTGVPIRIWEFPEAYDRLIARALKGAGLAALSRQLEPSDLSEAVPTRLRRESPPISRRTTPIPATAARSLRPSSVA